MDVTVCLLSGATKTLRIERDSCIGDLRANAKKSFSCNVVHLVTLEGKELPDSAAVPVDEPLTAVVAPFIVCSTERAFAALPGNGSLITWGHASCGGDSSTVQGRSLRHIYATRCAFDGAVCTWGNRMYGGDSSAVHSSLHRGIGQIFSTDYAFAALTEAGSVITWGNPRFGGDSLSAQPKLAQSPVMQLFSTRYAFAALTAAGKVVTWGNIAAGGDSSAVEFQLQESSVKHIHSNGFAFAALQSDGNVVTWGHPTFGGDCS
ncbi:unnamed protein product, partial [Polarella glacialis]